VFSDIQGNLKKVDLNINSQTVISAADLIPTTDNLNIPPSSNVLNLTSSPNLYRMNTADASLSVKKVNDNGARQLTYWDGVGVLPAGGYYTVSGNAITFYGDAIIGNEGVDDAQDYYEFSYTMDGTQNDIYTTSIPSGAEVYNMHGENGPRSLNILVGSRKVSQSDLLSSRPIDADMTDGVYLDESSGKIEFYGHWRPSYDENVVIQYIGDADSSRNQVQSFTVSTEVDTYNLTNPDLTTNRSMRIYVGGTEINYDGTNGYTYDTSSGRISLHGNARPDLSSNPTVEIKYINDNSNTNPDVYEISLNSSYPEIYNLGSVTSPSSIRVFRNSIEEINYSSVDGYQYNQFTNTIELYGTSRPNVGDTYSVRMIIDVDGVYKHDGVVEVDLSHRPETYGITDSTTPLALHVVVDGKEVEYDPTKTNGYFYNSGTNRIELYGNARPEAENSSNPDIKVSYLYESPATIIGNNTYDFQLSSSTLDYGVISQSEPRAIRIYKNDIEVPYDDNNGFTYNPNTKRLSLNGSYRPDVQDNLGDYLVYSINSEHLRTTVPTGAHIYKVELNNQTIQEAQDSNGDGYFYNGQTVEIVGNARPNITNNLSNINLSVQYLDSLEVPLDNSPSSKFFNNYCEHEVSNGLLDYEIDQTNLSVSLDGSLLSKDQYSFSDNKVLLNSNLIDINNVGSHKLSVDYRVRAVVDYEPISFNFQVGANSGNSLRVEIQSFDNMLLDTNTICVRTHKDAEKGLAVIDKALGFVLRQRGSIGAVEHTLDVISSNLSVMQENMTAALSRIQDTDMAREMMEYTKKSILLQTNQAMLAQVDQNSQGVLQLLKS